MKPLKLNKLVLYSFSSVDFRLWESEHCFWHGEPSTQDSLTWRLKDKAIYVETGTLSETTYHLISISTIIKLTKEMPCVDLLRLLFNTLITLSPELLK